MPPFMYIKTINVNNCYMIKSIYLNINQKNKNCKNDAKKLKFCDTNSKKRYKYLKPSNIDKQVNSMFLYPAEVFPEQTIMDSKAFLVDLSKKLVNKINKNCQEYRGNSSATLIEFVAKDCANQIVKQDKIDIEKYINDRYKFNCFYKKELKFLPFLIMQELLVHICNIKKQLENISMEIQVGAVLKKCKNNLLTNATIYGIFKFNKNLLKFNEISFDYVKKCVFNLICKLDFINLKLNVLINYIKYFNNNYCKL